MMALDRGRGALRETLVPFVIGPESQGRGYRLLAPASLSFPGSRDLAMILMEWSRVGEAEFAGCLPLQRPEGGAIVFRARHIRREALGEAAFLNGVLLDADQIEALGHHTELVLDLIQRPDGTTRFADSALALPRAAALVAAKPDGLGLAWRNRVILVDPKADREERLKKALGAIDPPEQRPRITGWVTTARLVSRGTLNPVRQSQLIVASAPLEAPLPEHLPSPESQGTDVVPPPSWRTWQAFGTRFAAQPAFAALVRSMRWRTDYARLTEDEMAEEALRLATAVLPPVGMVQLLRAALDAGAPYSIAAGAVALDYGEALGQHSQGDEALGLLLTTPQIAIDLVARLLRSDDADRTAPIEPLAHSMLEVMRNMTLTPETERRHRVVDMMKDAIAALPKKARKFDILGQMVQAWPEASKADLFALTAPNLFQMIFDKSPSLAAILANTVLDRKLYGAAAKGGIPVGLRDALSAIALLRGALCLK